MNMVSMRAHPKLILVLVVMITTSALLACSSDSPPPDDDSVDAFATDEYLCWYPSKGASFDVIEQVTTSVLGGGEAIQFTIEASVGDKGWRYISHQRDNPEIQTEIIHIFGEGYYRREINEQDVWGDWTVTPIQPLELPMPKEASQEVIQLPGLEQGLGDRPVNEELADLSRFCGIDGLIDVRYLGDAKINDTMVRHFSATIERIGGGDSYGNYEYWLEEEGKLIQLKRDVFLESRKGRSEQRFTNTVTFSNYGEPNIITTPGLPSTTITAQAIVENACSYVRDVTSWKAVNHTTTNVFEGGKVIELVQESRVSNRDVHVVSYSPNIPSRGEAFYIFDEAYYTRETNDQSEWEDWQVTPIQPWALSVYAEISLLPRWVKGLGVGPAGQENEERVGTSRFCGADRLVDVKYLGDTKVSGIAVRHYSASLSPTYTGGGDNYEQYEFWVDERGLLIRHSMDHFFRDPSGAGRDERVTYIITYYDVGEPNVITAPEIAPDPSEAGK